MDPTSLFDSLAGATGHPVNRPALNAYVANSQATNGLRSAQTEEALLNAQRSQEEQEASGRLRQDLGQLFGPGNESKANVAADAMISKFGNAEQAGKFLNDVQQNQFRQTMGDPGQLNSPAQTAAQQGITGKLAGPESVPENFTMPPGVNAPDVQQSPQGAAHTASTEAGASLHNAQAAAGGFNPHSGAMGSLTPDQIGLLQKAVQEGRLDPSRLNSRTAPILAGIEERNPGGVNFNRMIADANLQRNPTFQQKAMTMEALPTVMAHMTALGKKVGYSDVAFAGRAEKWLKGELNDPDLAEYMSVRNDALMNVASVMRGVGMSDQAHRAETEAAAPTLSPLALDGWFKGQMSSLLPRLEQQRRVTNLGEKHGAPNVLAPQDTASGPPTTPAGGAVSLDEYLKSKGF